MATNIKAAPRDIAAEQNDAARRRWVKFTDELPDGDPLGQPGSFAPRGKAGERQAMDQPAQPAAPQAAAEQQQRTGGRLALYTALAVVGLLALYLLLSAVVGWARVTLDDLSYGRPRTTHLAAYVGHAGEQADAPTNFVALNLDRRVVVIELPGGNTQGATTITGPYLFGSGEELTPVHLSTADVDGDGAPDLLLSVGDEQIVYINQPATSSFRMMTPAEHAALLNNVQRGGSLPTQAGGAK